MNLSSNIVNGFPWLAVHCTPELKTLADDVAHCVELAFHKLGHVIQVEVINVPGRRLLGCEIVQQLVMNTTGFLETPGPVSPQGRSLLVHNSIAVSRGTKLGIAIGCEFEVGCSRLSTIQ